LARVLDEDEPIEHWTLIGDELDLLAGRTGPSKLGLALWLKFFTVEGRFPAGRAELPDEAVGHVASQVKVPASDLGLFDWEGRTAERHRKTVRTFLGFRECSVADAEKLTARKRSAAGNAGPSGSVRRCCRSCAENGSSSPAGSGSAG